MQATNQPTGFRRVVRDIADLCELQLELLAVDGKVAANRLGAAVALFAIAGCFAFSAVTVTVLSIASLLHEEANWTVSSSLLAAAGIAALVGGIVITIGLVVGKKALESLDQTRTEFAENLRWIKAAIVGQDSDSENPVDHEFRATNGVATPRTPSVNGTARQSHF
jgi:Putative Actinobacterial Holin-X, holin superfamily III